MTLATLGEGGASVLPELSQGSTGEDVKKLQQQLSDLGYDVGGVDGEFGPNTAAALQQFQQDQGLQVDAIAGPQTQGALSAVGPGAYTGATPQEEQRLANAVAAQPAPAPYVGGDAAEALRLGSTVAAQMAPVPVNEDLAPEGGPNALPAYVPNPAYTAPQVKAPVVTPTYTPPPNQDLVPGGDVNALPAYAPAPSYTGGTPSAEFLQYAKDAAARAYAAANPPPVATPGPIDEGLAPPGGPNALPAYVPKPELEVKPWTPPVTPPAEVAPKLEWREPTLVPKLEEQVKPPTVTPPAVTEVKPPVVTPPAVTEPQPPVTEVKPPGTEPQPPVTEVKPPVAEPIPNYVPGTRVIEPIPNYVPGTRVLTPLAASPSAPDSVNKYTAALGAAPKSMADVLAGMNQGTNANMLPYETALRDLLAKMPNQAGMTPEQILASAQQYARTITDPQALALRQGLEQLRSSATGQTGQIEAGYAGAEESTKRLLTEAEARAVEDAIRRGGGRAGLVPYLQGKYGQPITEQFARGQAQKAASLADVQRQLGLGESQIQGRQEQLAQTQGNLTAQQQRAQEDLQYARQTGDWQRAWAATESLMSAATQAGQYGQQVALSVLPYTALTEYQRQRLPLEYAQTYYQAPGTAPGALKTPPEEPVSVREYANQKGLGGAISWDPVTEEIIINGQRIPLSSLTGMGGYETGGTAYLPRNVLDRYLGLGA